MGFNHQQYNTPFFSNAKNNDAPINEAQEKFGVQIIEASDVAEGELYWKVIGIHHLLPLENMSNHHAYLEALDEDGKRVKNPPAWAGWTWEGRQPNERADPILLDKPDNEPASNIAIFSKPKQVVSVCMKGLSRDSNDKSDQVVNIHCQHPDEPSPDGKLFNSWGHHSFYVVFQRTRKGKAVGGVSDIIGNAVVSKPTTVGLANKAISGKVTNGQDKTVELFKAGNLVSQRVVPESGYYRFPDLPSGIYSVKIVDVGVGQDNVQLDDTTPLRIVNLTVSGATVQTTVTTPTVKYLNHYVLLSPGQKGNLVAVLDYLVAFSVTTGFSVAEAKLARQVTIIGEGISATDRQSIIDSGSQVEVLPSDTLQTKLAARLQSGRAFEA